MKEDDIIKLRLIKPLRLRSVKKEDIHRVYRVFLLLRIFVIIVSNFQLL